ncbi:hypothetical protein ACFVX3_19810 [Rhodococcus erythropolis]
MRAIPPNLRLPIGSLIVAGLAVVFMAAWSVLRWPEMAPSVVTREVGGNHGQSVVSRGVMVVAMPALLAILAALLAVTPTLDAKLVQTVSITPQQNRGRGTARVLGAFLVGLSILLSALHIGFVDMFTDTGSSLEKIAPAAVGVLLIILGIYLPLARPSTTHSNEWVESFRAAQGPAYRLGGFALVFVGVVTVIAGVMFHWLALIIAVGGLVLTFAGIAVASLIKASRS